MGRTYLLVVDVETTGPSTKRHFLYAVASVIHDLTANEEVAWFDQNCRIPLGTEWDQATSEHFMHRTESEWRQKVLSGQLTEQTPEQMMAHWHIWFSAVLTQLRFNPREDRLVPMCDTPYYDILFMEVNSPLWARPMSLLIGEYNPWWDLRSYYAGMSKTHPKYVRYSTRQLYDMCVAGLIVPSEAVHLHDHVPLNDARCLVHGIMDLEKNNMFVPRRPGPPKLEPYLTSLGHVRNLTKGIVKFEKDTVFAE